MISLSLLDLKNNIIIKQRANVLRVVFVFVLTFTKKCDILTLTIKLSSLDRRIP